MKVVVDFNILFSALLKSPNKFSETIFLSEHELFMPRFAVTEFLKHKQKLSKLTKIKEDELLEMFLLLTKNIHVFDENMISEESITKAYLLCKDIDLKDMLYVALAIEINASLWTGDKQLKSGLIKNKFDNFLDI